MKFVPYDKKADESQGISISDFICSALMNDYQQKNSDASEVDLNRIRGEIESHIEVIRKLFEEILLPIKATIKLSEKQYVSLGNHDETLAERIIQTDNIDILLNEDNALSKTIDIIIDELRANTYIKPYDILFNQTLAAYNSESYNLAVLGFWAIIDGLLSDITKQYECVSIKKRLKEALHANDLYIPENEADIDAVMQKLSLLMVAETLAEYKSFSEEEPDALNRHRDMHGRTRKRKTKTDCEKLILFIYGLLNTANPNTEEFL